MSILVQGLDVTGEMARGAAKYDIFGQYNPQNGVGAGRMGKTLKSGGIPGPRLFEYQFRVYEANRLEGSFAIEGGGGQYCETEFALR